MDYASIIHQFIDGLINNPEKVVIEEIPGDSDKHVIYLVSCVEEDTGRLIGKDGSTAAAIREVISIAGKNNNQRVHIKFTSLQD